MEIVTQHKTKGASPLYPLTQHKTKGSVPFISTTYVVFYELNPHFERAGT